MNKDLPAHWAERLKLENFKKADEELKQKLADLTTAMGGENDDAIKAALEAARTAAAAYDKFEPLGEHQQKAIDAAVKRVGNAVRSKIVLQNNVSPSAEYVGILTDQIGDYKDIQHQRNVGVQYGLKVGAAAAMQRILSASKDSKPRCKKPRSRRPRWSSTRSNRRSPVTRARSVCIYRLKRPWVPDAGSWLCYDELKKFSCGSAGRRRRRRHRTQRRRARDPRFQIRSVALVGCHRLRQRRADRQTAELWLPDARDQR